MEIILNSELKPVVKTNRYSDGTPYSKDISYSLSWLANKRHPVEKEYTYSVIGNKEANVNLHNTGFVGLISDCYSSHLPLSISPHDIWIIILSEITKEVSKKPETYRHLFTTSSEKESISVPSDSLTEMPISVLSEHLSMKVLFDKGLIFKDFSTETPIITNTIGAIFCDMASPFYDYSMFCCGIPAIQLKGTVEDWEKLYEGANDITEIFGTPVLRNYLDKMSYKLEEFIAVVKHNKIDVDFWKDIFTQKNIGSGGDLSINGWIKDFFIEKFSTPKITNFTDTYGVVKYKQLQTNQEFVTIYGGFNKVLNSEGFYELEYSNYTLQNVLKTSLKEAGVKLVTY